MHPTQKECALALDGCCLTTMLSPLWVIGTTSLRVCCTIGSSHIPSWRLKPLLSLQRLDVIFFIDNEAAANAMIKGDSRLPVVGTMAMCVQLILIRYKITMLFEWVDLTWQMASAEMVRKTLGHWISIGNYTNSKAFHLLSHWPRCKNNSFQSLLNIDQSNYLEYVRILFCSLGLYARV